MRILIPFYDDLQLGDQLRVIDIARDGTLLEKIVLHAELLEPIPRTKGLPMEQAIVFPSPTDLGVSVQDSVQSKDQIGT